MTPFEQRVGHARAVLQHGHHYLPPVPVGTADQFRAASTEAHGLLDRVGTTWASLVDYPLTRRAGDTAVPTDLDLCARFLVVIGESRSCPHLRTGGPQPGWLRLDRRRLVCSRCVPTHVRPVIPDTACDFCREPSDTFTEFAIQWGPVVFMGNGAPCCFPYEGATRAAA